MRVLHQAAVGPIALGFDQRIGDTAARILGERDVNSCQQRLRIQSQHGGGGLTSLAEKYACGYVVAVL